MNAAVDIEGRLARAWHALATVEDPEIPALSIVDLGLIRFVRLTAAATLEVGVSPTYVGCPATDVIRRSVQDALLAAHLGNFFVTNVLSPAWSSDWITAGGRAKLELHGIVPPQRTDSQRYDPRRKSMPIACPRCRSLETETLSEFGSTPCKALHCCLACLEPFEYFKCI